MTENSAEYNDGLPPIYNLEELTRILREQGITIIDLGNRACKELIKAIRTATDTPVYIFESLDAFYYANDHARGDKMEKPLFLLDDGFILNYLERHPGALSIQDKRAPISPVILVYDNYSNRITRMERVLRTSGIPYTTQNIDQMETIYHENPDRTQDADNHERKHCLWIM